MIFTYFAWFWVETQKTVGLVLFGLRVLLPTDDDSGDLDDDGVDDGDKDENDDRFYLSRFPLTELHTAQV